MKRVGLRLKFAVLFIMVVTVVLGAAGLWSALSQQKQAEKEMLEKAQVLAQEMDAVWFDEDGVIADLEEGKTVFLPGDMVVGPIRDAMRVAAEAARRPQAKADSAAPTRSKK